MTAFLKSKWKSILLSAILIACLAGACVLGISLAQRASASVTEITRQSWSNLPGELPSGTTNYYKICYKNRDGSFDNAIFKVAKDTDGLKVYKMVIIEENPFDDPDDPNEEPNYEPFICQYFTASSSFFSGTEEWTLSLMQSEIDENPYSDIITVSPLCTSVKAEKVWDARSSSGYVEVANGTAVHFKLSGGADDTGFWVKKTSEGRLQISISGNENNYNDYFIVSDEKVICASVINAGDINAEKWVITCIGFDREAEDGALIEYQITEDQISNTTQSWTRDYNKLVHSFNDTETGNGTFVYSLILTYEDPDYTEPPFDPENPISEGPDTLERTVLKIKKVMVDGNVASVSVEGVAEGYIPENAVTYTAVTDAVTGNIIQMSSSNTITFNELSNIRIEDIVSSPQGVTVNFNIGEDNGPASVVIKLTESGKLSYSFAGLPADIFVADPEATSLNVEAYRVAVTCEG